MNEEKKFVKTVQAASPYLTLGLQLAITVVVFFFLGKYADDYFSTKPWLTIIGALFGCIGGLINFITTVKKISARNEH